MNEPLISVIVPVYNVEKYLARCVDSILALTRASFAAYASHASPELSDEPSSTSITSRFL